MGTCYNLQNILNTEYWSGQNCGLTVWEKETWEGCCCPMRLAGAGKGVEPCCLPCWITTGREKNSLKKASYKHIIGIIVTNTQITTT